MDFDNDDKYKLADDDVDGPNDDPDEDDDDSDYYPPAMWTMKTMMTA